MQKLVRWSVTVGLVASTLLSTWLSHPLKVLALPTAEVAKILQAIPVHTIINDKGDPLLSVVDDKTLVATVFMSRQEAQKVFQQLQKEQPDIAKQVKIQVLPLGVIYQAIKSSSNDQKHLLLQYIPVQTEVELAKQVLKAAGEEYQGGVPLFIASGGSEGGYLTVEQNNEPVVPFFFEKATIQQMIEQLKKDQPDLASSIKIEIVPLEVLIDNLEKKDDEFFKSIRLWPTQEMIQVIRSSNPDQPNQQ